MIFKVKEYIMKNAFTLIELVFVIIVMGIISMFGADLYFQVYKSYVHVRAMNQLEARTQNVVTLIASKLEDRIPFTTIARIYDEGKNADRPFTSIESATADHDTLEWIGQSIESKYASNSNHNVGWSGFMDMNSFVAGTETNAYSFNSQGSNFNDVSNIIQRLRFNTDGNFAIIFRDIQIDDSNSRYGGIQNAFGYGGRADMVANASRNTGNNERVNITYEAYAHLGKDAISEQYYLAHTGYAIQPDNVRRTYTNASGAAVNYEGGSKNFNLRLFYNYRPWTGTRYDANSSSAIIAEDVSLFRFKDDNGALAFKLCMRDGGRNFDVSQLDLIICKTQVVF